VRAQYCLAEGHRFKSKTKPQTRWPWQHKGDIEEPHTTHFLQRVGNIDSNVGACPSSHEEQRQEFKEKTDKKIHGSRMSLLLKFMAHGIKYFIFHGKFMATNTMKFHFAVLS